MEDLKQQIKGKTPQEILEIVIDKFKGKIALASSMGAEDQVLTDMICKINPSTRIFTLDTGRLFKETLELIDKTNSRYNITIERYTPDPTRVQEMIKEKGVDLFYESIENRKLCCTIRKTEPLKKALKGLSAWICGLRKDQSVTRFYNEAAEWDEQNALAKINPLLEWTEKQVWDYIRNHNVPYNPLHDKNFFSIGCEPCTRPVKQGEDIRSGRWWWEKPEQRECGLHK